MDHDLIIPKTCPLCDSDMFITNDKEYYHCSKLLEAVDFYTGFRLMANIDNKRQEGYSHYFIFNPAMQNKNHADEVFIFKPYHIFGYVGLNKFSIQKFSYVKDGVRTKEYYSRMQSDFSKMPRTEEDLQNWLILR